MIVTRLSFYGAVLVPVYRIVKSYLRSLYSFFSYLINNFDFIVGLTRSDFRSRYLGSHLGILWPFLQPSVTILIFWFVFQKGFRTAPVDNVPYVLWLTSGIVPWFFITETISTSSSAICEYSFIVKKIVFNISILPTIKILSALLIHLTFISLTLFIFILQGHGPDIFWLQIPYYLIASIVFLMGLSWVTASIMVFIRDLNQAIGILLQFGFYLTPVFWSLKMIPDNYKFFFKLNPAYYLIEGYRDALINKVWFWEKPALTLYFWSLSTAVVILGILVFKKTRPHFADVL
jgi:lipopolysaccharide transport system permease protein/teichoic acid transport system permease protein